jgi:hypothetical protein
MARLASPPSRALFVTACAASPPGASQITYTMQILICVQSRAWSRSSRDKASSGDAKKCLFEASSAMPYEHLVSSGVERVFIGGKRFFQAGIRVRFLSAQCEPSEEN